MNELFVPYEESLQLKDLGFDEPCFAYYLISEIERTGEIILHYCSRGKEILRNNDWRWVYENFPMFRKYLKSEHLYMYSTNSSKLMISAPTFSQAFKFFRNKYGLHHEVSFDSWNKETYSFSINQKKNKEFHYDDMTEYQSYEESELACLRKLIQIVKDGQ